MIITLTPKRAKFSAAHSLACFGDGHPCARKHGHTWWVQATFQGEAVDGVLVPYEITKAVVSELDHRDLDTMQDMLGIPTGENLLAWLVARFQAVCSSEAPQARPVRVELVEDPIPGDAHTLVWCETR